jgi:predicted transcriptional regulator
MPNSINVMLSDDLYERLKNVGARIDVTAICQNVIDSAVTTEEIKLEAMSERELAIARLKFEAAQEFDKWSRKGYREGLEFAPNLSFVELQQVMEWYELKFVENDESVSLSDVLRDGNSLLNLILENTCPTYVESTYLSGLLLGVMEFWNGIKNELD